MGQFRESLKATLQFERADRPCQFEWGYWNETFQRWHDEGLPAGKQPWDVLDLTWYWRVPGMDIRQVAREYPDLLIMGGLDKRELAKGRKAIDREVEAKLPPLFRRGGYAPTMDHHVPPDVSWDDFQYYLERTWEIFDQG